MVIAHKARGCTGGCGWPQTGLSGGSSTALSVGSAVRAAALTLRKRLETTRPPITVEETWKPDNDDYAMHSFGAVFAEVRVDADLAVPRVSRLVGVYSVGRISNPLTARSQMIGGLYARAACTSTAPNSTQSFLAPRVAAGAGC